MDTGGSQGNSGGQRNAEIRRGLFGVGFHAIELQFLCQLLDQNTIA
jgi:hypothetical protein